MRTYSKLTRLAATHAEALVVDSSNRKMDATGIRDTIQHAIALVDLARQIEDETVDRAHELGLSWTEVSHEYGISKQAAHQRFTRSR